MTCAEDPDICPDVKTLQCAQTSAVWGCGERALEVDQFTRQIYQFHYIVLFVPYAVTNYCRKL